MGELPALGALEIPCLLWQINKREDCRRRQIKMRPDASQICDIDISAVTSCVSYRVHMTAGVSSPLLYKPA